MNVKNNEIVIKSECEEIRKVESFAEQICDEYNIFNSYFGNILTALVECCEIIIDHIIKGKLDKREITIIFNSGKNGLMFEIKSPVEIFNINYLNEKLEDGEYKNRKKYLIIKYLSDQFTISENGKKCFITFYISSINYDKTTERNRLLSEYFEKISVKKKHNIE